MDDRETARMRKYGESKTTRIMTTTVQHVISGLEIRKFQADGLFLTRVYMFLLTRMYMFLLTRVYMFLLTRVYMFSYQQRKPQ